MTVTSRQMEDNKLLAALALAMVENPRATLQELAVAVGVSKATLYRFCQTRDRLVDRLMSHSSQLITEAIDMAKLETSSAREALQRLIANHLEHRELTAFLMCYWKDGAGVPNAEAKWEIALDAFFLRGQREGAFRIDVAAPALTEIWV